MYKTLGGKPVHHTWPPIGPGWSSCSMRPSVGSSWPPIPRLPACEYRVLPTATPTEGVGCVEAPRGTLTHHYTTDERGILTKVNLIVGTTNNNAAISDVGEEGRPKPDPQGRVSEGLLNRVEMAFRAYDPCFGCATHSLPGQMPLEIAVRDPRGELIQRLSQY